MSLWILLLVVAIVLVPIGLLAASIGGQKPGHNHDSGGDGGPTWFGGGSDGGDGGGDGGGD